MARLIEIPLKGGINTVTDAEDIGAGFVELINFTGNYSTGSKYKRFGMLKEWQGFKAETVITLPANSGDEVINNIQYWLKDDGVELFFLYDANSKQVRAMNNSFALFSTTSSSILENITVASDGDANGLIFTNTNATEINIYNNGEVLRFANGRDDKPIMLFDMADSRTRFWANLSLGNLMFADYATPRKVADAYLESEISDPGASWMGDLASSSKHDLSSKTLFYKVSYIYDGNQESPLDTIIGDTAGITGTNKVPQLKLTYHTLENRFNERITGINIYRAEAFAGPYYKIGSPSTLYTDTNVTHSSTASRSRKLYVEDTFDDDVFNSKVFISNSNSNHIVSVISDSGDGVIQISDDFGFSAGSAQDDTWGSKFYNTGTVLPGDKKDVCLIADSIVLYPAHASENPGGATTHTPGAITGTTVHGETGGGVTGDNHIRIKADGGTAYSAEDSDGTYATSTTYTICGWLHRESATTCNLTVVDGGATVLLAPVALMTGSTWGSGGTEKITVSGHDWYYFQADFTTQSNTTITTKFYGNTGSSQSAISMSRVTVFKKFATHVIPNDSLAYFGSDTIVATGLNFGVDGVKGSTYLFDGVTSSDESGWILENRRNAIRVKDDANLPVNPDYANSTAKELFVGSDYFWNVPEADKIMLTFYDKGLPNGTLHAFDETSNAVNYKYATISNGRQFVANVKLDPDGEAEEHKDWIIFSELQQYDSLPITNYIQLNDLQGGEITGISKVLNDIVVFMERGVFRLSVPSASPADWSLTEAYENIGCKAPKSIVQYNGGVFFLAEDNFYFIDPNFNLIPVGMPIQDIVAGFGTDAEAFVDLKYNQVLLIEDSADTKTHYVYDLLSEDWQQEKWTLDGGGNDVYGGNYFTDKDGDTHFVSRTTTGGHIRELRPASSIDMDKTSSTGVQATLKTGLIRIADSGENALVRRLNIRATPAGQMLSIYVYDEKGTAIYTNTSFEIPTGGNMSIRIGARAELVQVKIMAGDDDGNYSIERLALEVD